MTKINLNAPGLCKILAMPLVFLITGCQKILDVNPSPTAIENKAVFSSDGTAIASVNGIYSQAKMQINNTDFIIANGSLTTLGGLWSDELHFIKPEYSPSIPPFENHTLDKSNSILDNSLWSPAYAIIYQANACLEGLNNSTTLTSSTKNELIGECLFLRSFFYFYMVNLFNDVPLVTSTNYDATQSLARTPINIIYDTLENDLIQASQLLGTNSISNNTLRANKWAAIALLARIYLYEQKWSEAEQTASDVINSQQYSLVADLNQVFKNNSSEAIWQVMGPNNGAYSIETAEGYIFNSSYISFIMDTNLVNNFEPGDLRRTQWVSISQIDTSFCYRPHKYQETFSEGSTNLESYMMLRFAEQYLIRAEARYELNEDIPALNDLDMIRQRAGLPLLSPTSPSHADIQQLIEHERKIELFCEWGHRWLDLKRTGRAATVLAPIKPGWKDTDLYFAIPYSQILANPALTQNPGYQ